MFIKVCVLVSVFIAYGVVNIMRLTLLLKLYY